MFRVALVLMCLLCACAGGVAGDVWGVSVGQSRICSEHFDPDGKIVRKDCISGGPVSPEAAEQLGPLTRVVGALLGVF